MKEASKVKICEYTQLSSIPMREIRGNSRGFPAFRKLFADFLRSFCELFALFCLY